MSTASRSSNARGWTPPPRPNCFLTSEPGRNGHCARSSDTRSGMFDVEICESKRVVLIRFRGELAEADFTALDALGREKQGGPPHDVVFDMTAVEKIHLATDFVSKRGELPQAFTDRERIYVVQQEDLKLLI